MKNNNNKAWWWAFGIIAVVLIIVIAMHAKRAAMNNDGSAMTGDDSALVASEDVSEGSVDAPAPGSTVPAATLSYQQALVKYKDARIQFTAACQATPSKSTYKNGTLVMLDNRSASARTLHLGSMGNVSIKGWGFKIVRFSSTMLPNVITIDCDSSQNVAQIDIQA